MPPPSPILSLINDHDQTKHRFKVDHAMVNLNWPPFLVVDHTRFWFGLYSHRRVDEVCKGMVQVDLNTPKDDSIEMQNLKPASSP